MICDICGNVMEDGTQICPVCGRQFFSETSKTDTDVPSAGAEENAISEEAQDSNVSDADTTLEETEEIQVDEENEGTEVLTGGIEMGERDEKTVALDPDAKIFDSKQTAGGMPNGMPPMGGANGVPPMGPNGMPPMGGPNAGANTKPPKAKKKKKMSTGKKVALITISLVILVAAGTVAAIFVPKFLNYDKAQEKLADGKIDDAMELFEDLGNFKDAEDMVNGGAYFEYATALMEEKDYSLAAEYFEKAADSAYEGASDKAFECHYYYAEELLAQGRFEDAMDAFRLAGSYSDASSRIKECYYEQGISYMDNGDYENAVDCFTNAEGYQDADDMIKQCYYYEAEALEADGEYEEAYDRYLLSEYSDYETRANDCMYSSAKAYYDNGKYEEAIEIFEQIDTSYKDCSKDIDNCYLGLAKACENGEDYQGAVEYYEMVTGSDVDASIRKNKANYIEAHFTNTDALTMEYLCDLKYANYGTALEDYQELCGWTVGSFVNHAENDYETVSDTVDMSDTVYVHTLFVSNQEEEEALNLKAYVIYSTGTKSDEILFESVESNYGIWVSIIPGASLAGDTTLYIFNADTGMLVEKYTFTMTE